MSIQSIASRYNITEAFYHYVLDNNGEVVSLEVYDSEYEDLQDCDYIFQFASQFKHLKQLSVEVINGITEELSVLEPLQHLETIYIESDTKITSLDVVYHFPKLKSLYLQSSSVTDITPVLSCKQLTSLGLHNAQISDLTGLDALPQLTEVFFSNNKIENIDVLKKLKHLRTIDLAGNKIQSISALEEHTTLRMVNLIGNAITDINPLRASTQITRLHVAHNKIDSIDVLENHSELMYLNISDNKVADVSVLKDKVGLNFLNLSNNPIQSLDAIYNLPSLTNLHVSGLNIQDTWKPFVSKLSYLDLSTNQIEDGGFLENQDQLLQLNLSQNTLTDVEWLNGMGRLKHLNLSDNRLDQPFPIYYFFEIDGVDLRGNAFGNALFERYKGCASHSSIYKNVTEVTSFALITQLEKAVADFYFKKDDLDSTLAYYYCRLDKQSESAAKIYLSKLCSAPSEDVVYIKFYVYKMVMASHKILSDEETYNQVQTCLENIENTEQRSYLLELLMHVPNFPTFSSIFNPLEFYIYECKHPDAYLTDEVLYLKGMGFNTNRIEREHLDRGLYYLKALYNRKSPFYYTLKYQIRTTLLKHFAYTPEERKTYDYYLERTLNIDQYTIEKPTNELDLITGMIRYRHGYKFVYDDPLIMEYAKPNIPNRRIIDEAEEDKIDWLYIIWAIIAVVFLIKAFRFF